MDHQAILQSKDLASETNSVKYLVMLMDKNINQQKGNGTQSNVQFLQQDQAQLSQDLCLSQLILVEMK